MSTKPWYKSTSALGFFAPEDDKLYAGQRFAIGDSPLQAGTDVMSLLGDDVDRFDIDLDYKLYFSVRTKDAVNGSDQVYTQRAAVNWSFNGSGNVNADGVWRPIDGVTGNTCDPAKAFTVITSGARVPVTTGLWAREVRDGDDWATMNQP